MTDESIRSRWLRVVAPAAVVAVLAIVAVVVFVATDDDQDVSTAVTTTLPEATTTSTLTPASPATSTTTGATTTTAAPADTDSAVWPTAGSTRRFTDPVEAATSFATDFVGFTDPVVGEFQQGDSRSGEVEVRPRATGPVTTVLVRRLGADDSWWVLGTATANIEVDDPTALMTIAEPVKLSGRARAFEGNVNVEIRQDDATAPLATGFVTGRGDGVLGPFDDDLAYPTPTATMGAVLFVTHSAEDGRVWEAAVIRIRFPAS